MESERDGDWRGSRRFECRPSPSPNDALCSTDDSKPLTSPLSAPRSRSHPSFPPLLSNTFHERPRPHQCCPDNRILPATLFWQAKYRMIFQASVSRRQRELVRSLEAERERQLAKERRAETARSERRAQLETAAREGRAKSRERFAQAMRELRGQRQSALTKRFTAKVAARKGWTTWNWGRRVRSTPFLVCSNFMMETGAVVRLYR